MHYTIRTVKNPNSVVYAAKLEYRRQTCLAINKGRVIDIRDIGLGIVNTIYPNEYVTLIIPVSFKELKGLLMVGRGGEYVVIEDDKAVLSGRMPISLCYVRYVKSSKNLVFIAEDGTVVVAAIGNGGLIFDEGVNDFNYYRTLDCFSHRGDFMFLLEDISGDVFLARYSTNPTKVGIVLREKTLLKRGLRFMKAIEDGLFFLGNGKIYYYVGGKFTLESEFANLGVKSSLSTSRGVVLSMEDGEVLRVSLERKKGSAGVDKKKEEEGMASGMGVDGEKELSFKVIVLGNAETWFSTMVHLEKDLYYCGSKVGNSCYMEIGDKLRVLREFENDTNPTGLVYEEDSFKYLTERHLKKITYKIDLSAESRYGFPKAVKMFGIFKSYFIVSYANEGKIFGPSMVVEKSFDEILNIYVGRYCYFNTREHLFCFRDKDLLVLEDKSIVLSSYREDLCAIFTEERLLKIICLETMSCIRSIQCSYEVSLLYLNEYLFVSTYDDELFILDEFLNVVHERRYRTLKTACSIEGRLFFGDMVGTIYEAVFSGKNDNESAGGMKDENEAHGLSSVGEAESLNSEFNRCLVRLENDGADGASMRLGLKQGSKWRCLTLKPLCSSDSMVETLVPVGRYIMAIGRSTVFMDPSDFSFHRCSSTNVTHAFFTDQLYVSTGRSILKCPFKFLPRIRIVKEDLWSKVGVENRRTMRFVASMGAEEVVGSVSTVLSINNDPAINSYLTLKKKRCRYELLLPDEVVMDGRYVSRHLLVTVSNLMDGGSSSKLSMYSTKKKCIKTVYENVNEGAVYALEASGDYVATHRGANLCVYKRQAQILAELCTIRIDFIPYRIAIDNNRIACACTRRSFGLFLFNRETNHLSPDFLFTQKLQVESMAFIANNVLITTTDGEILLFDESRKIRAFPFGERITSIKPGSLSLNKNNAFYFTTENDGLGVLAGLELGSRDHELLLRLEAYANSLALFSKEKTDRIVDIDVINNMDDYHLNEFISENGYSRKDIIRILDRINEVY